MRVLTCVGTRPNFIKITQMPRLFAEAGIEHKLLHTGQHFDANMSDVFFRELKLPEPDVNLGARGDTPLQVIADIIHKIERPIKDWQPDLVLVPGDVNSSMACAVAANKLNIPVGHIESGLRSFDRTMPEEHNRIIIDAISDLLFVTEQSGMDNLLHEGKERSRIHFVGNTMIDTLVACQPTIAKSDVLDRLGHTGARPLITVTLHRPSNVDSTETLTELSNLLKRLAEKGQVVFPVHPRTQRMLKEAGLEKSLSEKVTLCDPLGYIDFMKLVSSSTAVVTDSGGIQEETTYLGIPCITLRRSTERPVTVSLGTNTLVPDDPSGALDVVDAIVAGMYTKRGIPDLWDGHASERLLKVIADSFKQKS